MKWVVSYEKIPISAGERPELQKSGSGRFAG
jgi:hypothetical protein